MRIEGAIWFTDANQTFGVVLGRDDFTNEPKAYIGEALGLNENDDVISIAQHGAKILPEQAKAISDFLNSTKEKS